MSNCLIVDGRHHCTCSSILHGDSRDRGPAMIDLAKTCTSRKAVPRTGRNARLPANRAQFCINAVLPMVAREFCRDDAYTCRRSSVRSRKRQSAYAPFLGR